MYRQQGSPKVTHFQVFVSRGGAGKDTERKDRILEPGTLPNIFCLICFKTFEICSANKLTFKAARGTRAFGCWCVGHIYPGWHKGRYAKFFTFVFLSLIEVFNNQEDCPNYLALIDHSILTNQKCLEEIFFKLCFKKRAIVTPGSGDTPYIMTL